MKKVLSIIFVTSLLSGNAYANENIFDCEIKTKDSHGNPVSAKLIITADDDYTAALKTGDGETGKFGDKLATGFKQGAMEFGVKKAAEKSIMYTLSKYGIKSIPLVGSLAAAISALAEGALFLKDLYQFTQKLLSVSSVELEGGVDAGAVVSGFDASRFWYTTGSLYSVLSFLN